MDDNIHRRILGMDERTYHIARMSVSATEYAFAGQWLEACERLAVLSWQVPRHRVGLLKRKPPTMALEELVKRKCSVHCMLLKT